MIIAVSLLSLFLLVGNPLFGIPFLFGTPFGELMFDKDKVVQTQVAQTSPTAEQECLQNGAPPPWVTINPNDPSKTLWMGELVEVSLNLPKSNDGSCATCQYKMKSKTSDETWNCLGLTNFERLKKQSEQPKTVMWDKLEFKNETNFNA